MKPIYVFFLSILLPLQSVCQWATDPTVNNPICLASNYQDVPQIVEDGSGGAIIVWEDFRNGSNYDIYAQRINKNGIVQWTANGVVISSSIRDQTMPEIISDGNGGAIITWTDFRSGNYSDIYGQKINSSGVPQWTLNGVAVCSAVNSQHDPSLISDGNGGAIITWTDKRNGDTDIYAQHINSAGVLVWSSDGVVLCSAIAEQETPSIASVGFGGAIIAWADERNGTALNPDSDIYAQRIDVNGAVMWMADGISVASLTGFQNYPEIINNSSSEVIISWHDSRNGMDADVFSQRIKNDGGIMWNPNGIALCTAAGSQTFPMLASDNAGGAIITWQDYRSGAYDVYAQRTDVDGNVLWVTDGVAISTETNAQMSPDITSDGQGGAVITWRDYRDNGNQDIYAQRISNNGTVQWTDNGVAVCIAVNNQYTPSITSDGNGGAIIAWWDFRAGTNSVDADIYAQQISHGGQLGVVTDVNENITFIPEEFKLHQNYPNPFNPSTVISWQSPVGSWQTIKVFDVLGNEVATLVNEYKPAGMYNVQFTINNLASGIYFYQLKTGDYIQTKKMMYLK